jgi:hypothetical protein
METSTLMSGDINLDVVETSTLMSGDINLDEWRCYHLFEYNSGLQTHGSGLQTKVRVPLVCKSLA